MAGARPFIDAKIKQRAVLMFTKKQCPDSKLARSIMGDYKLRTDVFECCDIDSRQDCTQIENYLQVLCLTDTRSVRSCVCVGGCVWVCGWVVGEILGVWANTFTDGCVAER